MKLKTKLMMFTAALALSSSMAFAAITSNDVVTSYQAEAYTYIKIKEGPTQIKVEAIKDGNKLEVIYDKASGAVLSKETSVANAVEAARTGVFVRQSGDDFDGEMSGQADGVDDDGVDDDGVDDDGVNGDDNDDDNGSDDDNGGDDNDNGSDDNGGDDDNGSDDNDNGSDDDHGSDNNDNGSDDNDD